MARIDAAIAERARKQLGLIRTDQLDQLGCHRDIRRTRLQRGSLVRVAPTVFAVGGLPPDWRRDVLAAAWAAGRGTGVASHRSAARLWGFDGISPRAIDVTVDAAHRPEATIARIWRSSDLTDADLTAIGAIPVTTKVRTLVDLGAAVSKATLESAVDGALRDGLVARSALVAAATRLRRRGRSGPGQLLAVLGETGRRTDSWLERELLRLFSVAGLPLPSTQVALTADGRLARVDALFERAQLVVEVDGHRTHSTRRDRQADAEREARLVAAGWRVIRFTYEDVTERPGYVVATVRQLLGLANSGVKRGV